MICIRCSFRLWSVALPARGRTHPRRSPTENGSDWPEDSGPGTFRQLDLGLMLPPAGGAAAGLRTGRRDGAEPSYGFHPPCILSPRPPRSREATVPERESKIGLFLLTRASSHQAAAGRAAHEAADRHG